MNREFQLGQTVYHRTDEMQAPGLITGILERPGSILYLVAFGTGAEKECYEIELSNVKTIY